MHQHEFCLPGAFRMTVRKFHIVMQNQFSRFPWCAAAKAHSVSFRMTMQKFRMTVRKFRMVMRN